MIGFAMRSLRRESGATPGPAMAAMPSATSVPRARWRRVGSSRNRPTTSWWRSAESQCQDLRKVSPLRREKFIAVTWTLRDVHPNLAEGHVRALVWMAKHEMTVNN
jgi:hypothetical protein